MHFCLVDAVLERSPERVVTVKNVSAAEEYLQDHFPGFPVLPGVMMLEALVQAGRVLLAERGEAGADRLVLGGVRALKYGRFVKPGETLRVEVAFAKAGAEPGNFELKGEGTVLRPGSSQHADANSPPHSPHPPHPPHDAAVAVSGRLTLRPVRLGSI